jgi:hypothetical protein
MFDSASAPRRPSELVLRLWRSADLAIAALTLESYSLADVAPTVAERLDAATLRRHSVAVAAQRRSDADASRSAAAPQRSAATGCVAPRCASAPGTAGRPRTLLLQKSTATGRRTPVRCAPAAPCADQIRTDAR